MLSQAAAAAAFWVGACIGSFLNVVAYRLPREESIVSPGSRCPKCRRAILWRDNLPIVGWLLIGGRCRFCRARVSARYPAVELATAVLFLGLWLRWSDRPAWAVAAAAATAMLVAVALIDWDTFTIPDELSLGLLALGVAASPLNPYLRDAGLPWWQPFLYSIRGAAIGFSICFAVAEIGERLFGKEAMGGGDVKLLAAVGAWTGGLGAFDCLMVASLIGSVYGVALIARRRLKRSDPIPFGPVLAAAATFNFFVLLPLGFPFASLS
jgi:leader peptidase (prepilin peptidase)/N-methyltransferase